MVKRGRWSISYNDRLGDIIDEAMNVQNTYVKMEKELFIKAELDWISIIPNIEFMLMIQISISVDCYLKECQC